MPIPLPRALGAIALFLASGASLAQPGPRELHSQDLESTRPGRCEADIYRAGPASRAPALLMRLSDGSQGWARFASLPAQSHHQALDERLVFFARSERRQSFALFGPRRLFATYGGALPFEQDPLAFETYRVKLALSPAGACPATPSDPRSCSRFAGTLASEYRLRRSGSPPLALENPPIRVELVERCDSQDYRYYGLFSFPGWLDQMAALLLRSR